MCIRDRLYDDMLHDEIIWDKPINSNDIVERYKNLNKYYIDNNNIIYLIKNNVCRPKFDCCSTMEDKLFYGV